MPPPGEFLNRLLSGLFVMTNWFPVPGGPDTYGFSNGIGFFQVTGYSYSAGSAYNYDVIQRNYDPETLAPANSVNDGPYVFYILMFSPQFSMAVPEYDGGPGPSGTTAVADYLWSPGGFYTGLTADDVGGLSYLISTNNVAYELLPPDVSGIPANPGAYVNGAWRPGVNKINFVPQSLDASGQFTAMTNPFTDTYLTNGATVSQQVQRVTTQPDFLFCAGDTKGNVPGEIAFSRTGTSNWVNNAALNGNPSGAGPGVIQPPVTITFAKAGPLLLDPQSANCEGEANVEDHSWYWGSYDDSTNAPIIYPISQTGGSSLLIHIWLSDPDQLGDPEPGGKNVDLSVTSQSGAFFVLQTSTNLSDWSPLGTFQNNGTIGTFIEEPPLSTHRFYRLIPQ